MTPEKKSLVIANAQSDSLLFVDPKTATVERTVRGILDPYHPRFSPYLKWLVIVGKRLNHVDLYRWNGKEPTLSKRIPTRKTPSHHVAHSDGLAAHRCFWHARRQAAVGWYDGR